MKSRAFTLIELLVVVLIIGILAAIALPQYQVAVAKTKYNTLKTRVHSLLNAVETYHLANGTWPADMEDLDISFPGEKEGSRWTLPDGTECQLWYDANGNGGAARCGIMSGLSYYVEFQNGSTRSCRVVEDHSNAKIYMQVCLNDTQNTSPSSRNDTSIYDYKD